MPVAAIGAAVGGIGSIIGGVMGSGAAKKAATQQFAWDQNAAKTATEAAREAEGGVASATAAGQGQIAAGTAMGQAGLGDAQTRLREILGQQTGNLQPYLQAGTLGATSLSQMLSPGGDLTKQFSFNPADVANTPEYKFALEQGTQAVQRQAAAQGLLNSGGTLKSLMNYGQGLASQQYQQAYNNALNTFQTNRNNTLGGLMALIGTGQFGTGQYNQALGAYGSGNAALAGENANLALSGAEAVSGTGMQGATTIGNLGMEGAQLYGQDVMASGNAQAAGTMGAANAWQNAIGGVGQAAGGYALSQMLGAPTGAGGGGFTPYGAAGPFTIPTMPTGSPQIPEPPTVTMPNFTSYVPLSQLMGSAYTGTGIPAGG